ncbi:MAG: universal stress protein [Bacteroidetes bacterium]|nr:MAG: universal stress protein [Bacteroidota bacterium]
MKKILLPTDFSDDSMLAAEYALGLAEDLDAHVHLLHVFLPPGAMGDPLAYGAGRAAMAIPETAVGMKAQLLARMERFVHPLRLKAPERISYAVVEGATVEEIVDTCTEESMDMILMSTHGESALYRTLFGSVTAATIRRAPVPVLALPRAARYQGIKKIAYATDGSITDGRRLWQLSQQFQALNPQLYAVHVVEANEQPTHPQDEASISQELDRQLHQYDPDLPFETHVIKCEQLREGLEQFIQEHDIDLLALSTHKRNLFASWFYPSTAKHLLFHLATPLWVMHRE